MDTPTQEITPQERARRQKRNRKRKLDRQRSAEMQALPPVVGLGRTQYLALFGADFVLVPSTFGRDTEVE